MRRTLSGSADFFRIDNAKKAETRRGKNKMEIETFILIVAVAAISILGTWSAISVLNARKHSLRPRRPPEKESRPMATKTRKEEKR